MRTNVHVVLLPAWYASEKVPYGGAFVHAQAMALRRYSDVEVGVIYLSQDSPPIRPGMDEGINYVLQSGPRIPKVGALATKLWQSRYGRLMKKYIRRYGRPDVIHAHGYIAGLAASYIKDHLGIPFVLTEHTSNILTRSVPQRHVQWLDGVYKGARHLYAVSHALRSQMSKHTQRRIHVLPNCYDEEVFRPMTEMERPGFEFITVTSLVAVKRIDLLIDSFAALSNTDTTLRIIGQGPLEQALKDRCSQSEVQDRVFFTGALQPSEVAKFLQNAHVFVSSSSVETFGVAIIEAMACGLPVICTRSGGPEDFVDERVGKLIPAGSKEHLVQAMEQLLEDYNRFDQMDIATRTRTLFNGQMMATRLNGIYIKALN